MTPDSERVAVEERDRISNLPSNVIDCILERLPVHDAARTSILSRKWRYTWAMLPNLVLTNSCCVKLIKKSQSFFRETVDQILLQHIGNVVEFSVDVSELELSTYTDFDIWMLYVTRNGVKKLVLYMSDNATSYKLPSYIFNCPTLTYLDLYNCTFRLPKSFLGFQNLITLHLERITFVPTSELCVINVPLLVNLSLKNCQGTQYLNIVSSKLECLTIHNYERHYLDLNCFINCKNLINLELQLDKEAVDIPNPNHDERSPLEKLLLSLGPTIEILYLDSFCLQLLSADIIPMGLHITLNCLWDLSLRVHFGELSWVSCALQLIESCPNLSKLYIWVCNTRDNVEAVSEYLDTPACLDQPLNKLMYVTIDAFEGSKTELLFVKLLCARTPSLARMSIKQYERKDIGCREERNIAIELMRFPRASTRAELFYFPCSV